MKEKHEQNTLQAILLFVVLSSESQAREEGSTLCVESNLSATETGISKAMHSKQCLVASGL